jgi:alkaline phosphatase D
VPRFTRRDFLTASAVGLGTLRFDGVERIFARQGSDAVFRHGVASGDPLRDRVVLWTRVTPGEPAATVDVDWMIARDARMTRVIARGRQRTSAERDYTIKIDAVALDPGSTYYYRFASRGSLSPIGRTRTLPTRPTASVRLALASCANLPFGFFNVYGRIAERRDLNAVVHLGDYLYEYGGADDPGWAEGDARPPGRLPSPDREILTLEDYRARYAQYREDPDLQAAHRQHPFIVVADDNDVANDAWTGGAANHQPGEGEWEGRKAAARRAWREWMPVREALNGESRMYRTFALGDLGDLLMLDTRLEGREIQVRRDRVADLERPSRQLLGSVQESWLFENLRDSRAAAKPWQILGQQVMFAPQVQVGAAAAAPDSWDGYRGARARVFAMAAAAEVKHLLVLTGDAHSAWGYDLAREPFDQAKYDPATGRGAVGTEIVTPAVTSPGGPTPDREAALVDARPHLKYVHGRERGYAVLDLTPKRLHVDWWFVPTIVEPTASERCAKSMGSEADAPCLVDQPGPSPERPAPDPAPDLR